MRINKMIVNLNGNALISKQILKTNPLSNVWISVGRIFMWILGIKGLDYVCNAGSDLELNITKEKVCSSQRSQAFELATTTERLQVGGGYTVLIKNYLN